MRRERPVLALPKAASAQKVRVKVTAARRFAELGDVVILLWLLLLLRRASQLL